MVDVLAVQMMVPVILLVNVLVAQVMETFAAVVV